MITFNKKDLNTIVRSILMGRSLPELDLYIKGDNATTDRSIEGVPPPFERRRNASSDEQRVSYPNRRLIIPSSRSSSDQWTIIYNNRIAAKGRFDEVEKVLREVPRDMLTFPKGNKKEIVYSAIIALLAGLCFAGGLIAGSAYLGAGPMAKAGALAEKQAADAKDIAQIQETLKNVMERQDVLRTVLVKTLSSSSKQEGGPDRARVATEPTFEERAAEQVREMDLRQLAELEQRRFDLVLKDQELENLGYKQAHVNRMSVLNSIAVLEKRIGQLKNKYK